jgi:hypothetical protein
MKSFGKCSLMLSIGLVGRDQQLNKPYFQVKDIVVL